MSKWSSAYQDSRWQEKRLEIMQRDDFRCQACGAKGEGALLHVHHIYYEPNTAPWEAEEHALITLCDKCHKQAHELKTAIYSTLSIMCNYIPNLIMLMGFCDSMCQPPQVLTGPYAMGYAKGCQKISQEKANEICLAEDKGEARE